MNAVSDIDAKFEKIFGMIRIKVPYTQLNRKSGGEPEDGEPEDGEQKGDKESRGNGVKGYFYLIKRPVSVDDIDDKLYPRLILRLYSLNPLADQISYNQMKASCSGYPLRQYGNLESIGKEVKEIREYVKEDKNIFYGILIKRMLIYFFGCLPLEVESFFRDNNNNLVKKWDYLCYLTNLSTQRMMEKINKEYKNSINSILNQWYDGLKDSGSTDSESTDSESTDPGWKKYFDPPSDTDRLWNSSTSTGDGTITVGDAPTVRQIGYRPCGFEIIKDQSNGIEDRSQKTRIKTRELMTDYLSFSNSETTGETKGETKIKIFKRRTNSDIIVEDFCKATNGGDDDSILYGNYYLVDESQFKSTWPII